MEEGAKRRSRPAPVETKSQRLEPPEPKSNLTSADKLVDTPKSDGRMRPAGSFDNKMSPVTQLLKTTGKKMGVVPYRKIITQQSKDTPYKESIGDGPQSASPPPS